jgi:hypothetical protein
VDQVLATSSQLQDGRKFFNRGLLAAYLTGGSEPGLRRDGTAWEVDGDLFMFGGSLPFSGARAAADGGEFITHANHTNPMKSDEWNKLAAERGVTEAQLNTAFALMNTQEKAALLVRLDEILWHDEDNPHSKTQMHATVYTRDLWRLQPGSPWELLDCNGQALRTYAALAGPTSRAGAVSWTDGDGAAYLFGGYDRTILGLSDLWVLNIVETFGQTANGKRRQRPVWQQLGGTHTQPSIADVDLLVADGEDAVAAYFEHTVARRYPAGRAFATMTVVPLPAESSDAGEDLVSPDRRRAEGGPSVAGFMFGGVLDLLHRFTEPVAGAKAAPPIRPMKLSDVWFFEGYKVCHQPVQRLEIVESASV